MPSTALHIGRRLAANAPGAGDSDELPGRGEAAGKHPFLVQLGERVRALRSQRGMTRKSLALATGVSERHLANLELGQGNASVLVLLDVAHALKCSMAELLGDATTRSPEWLMLRELLQGRDEATLRRVREAIGPVVDAAAARAGPKELRPPRIALIGLRGAGKTTLGRMLADDLGFPFLELSREIEKLAGCTVPEIQALYGQNAYRRYERRAVEQTVQLYPEAVIATPGGLVSDPASFNLVLSHCTTVWLKAHPRDHMNRVAAQGDMRPMAGNQEAMEDLRSILDTRAPFYAKAELHLDTSAQAVDETFAALRSSVRAAIGPG
jgi:XRE family transcriptional regulator, aerobic/anaerobic benzoate catabolism transcriptional regulator